MAGNEHELCGCEESVELRAALRAVGREETQAWTLCGKAEVRIEALKTELENCRENGQRLLLERDEALRASPRHLVQKLSDTRKERDLSCAEATDLRLELARVKDERESLLGVCRGHRRQMDELSAEIPSVERRVRVLESQMTGLSDCMGELQKKIVQMGGIT